MNNYILINLKVNQPPDDSISGMAFSPVKDHLAVSSWDNYVRIIERTRRKRN